MSDRTPKKPGIADSVAAHRKHKDCFPDELDRLIDWKSIAKVLRQKLKRVANAVGNPAYPPLFMFKILLLQRWNNLCDVAVDEALCDSLSFIRFTGLSSGHDEVPDDTTISRFPQSLVERAIGTPKRGYGFLRARYLGLAKVELEFLLNARAFTLKKAVLRGAC